MARTRAQSQAAASEKGATSKPKAVKEEKSKSQRPEKRPAKSRTPKKSATGKRVHEEVQESHEDEAKQEPTKKTKSSEATSDGRAHISNPKLESILSKYGVLPLQNSKLPAPEQPLPETMLALVFNAMLTSARISHEIAARSVSCLIDAGYHDIQKLKNSSWQERTEVLTEGGYTHYREKTATMLGDLADLVLNKYGGDLNNVFKRTDSSPSQIRAALKEIKGIGEVGLDIFCDTAQAVWPCLAPFANPRSLKTAQQLGLGSVEELWQEVGEDALMMCKLATALTTIRLGKKTSEFT
ncbi:hypothetical protein GJ744_006950 [Endocarpon pusillum]|uniref:HhH-GPD domain-containing protein n=1 Tax=Endocarpon pusillum TaxID=364733 RepID=A0A8H7ALB3_9EURO|nr:hypothetical protein GJ744_006950 [Endocarpon pusillum]